MKEHPIKERPIIFSTPMVKAILENRKTQTRRIIKPQPKENTIRMYAEETIDFSAKTDRWYAEYLDNGRQWTDSGTTTCPYGTIGDKLWVRETISIDKEPGLDRCGIAKWIADQEEFEIDYSEFDSGRMKYGKTYPSIHMPRWASRITLEITDIRVQRLQEITEEDVEAEGLFDSNGMHLNECFLSGGGMTDRCNCGDRSSVEHFEKLWDSINTKRGYSWQSDPWVWALTFKRIS